MADVDAKHGLITCVLSMKNAWTAVALFVLALFGNGGQHFWRIGFVKFVDHELICDGLSQRRKNPSIDCSQHGPARIAPYRHQIAVLF